MRKILPGTGRGTAVEGGGGGGAPQAPRPAEPLHQPAAGPPPPAGEDLFARVAVRLAGAAGVMFGWAPDAFWVSTPAELDALAAALSGEEVPPLDGAAFERLKERFPDG